MASENVVQFTDANFESEVLGSSVPVLVDFWAEWCGPCRMIAPAVSALADEYKGRVKVGKLDTDNNRASAIRFQINSIPAVLVFKNGQLVQKITGARAKRDYAAALDKVLGEAAS